MYKHRYYFFFTYRDCPAGQQCAFTPVGPAQAQYMCPKWIPMLRCQCVAGRNSFYNITS